MHELETISRNKIKVHLDRDLREVRFFIPSQSGNLPRANRDRLVRLHSFLERAFGSPEGLRSVSWTHASPPRLLLEGQHVVVHYSPEQADHAVSFVQMVLLFGVLKAKRPPG
ncbi:MAG: hypothetical protein V1787_06255 [Candidatus Micrarchaeota archaeon]